MKIFAIPPFTADADEIEYEYVADSSLTPWRKPFFLPDFDTRFTVTVMPAIVLCRLGKTIPERFASRYYAEGSVAVSFRAAGLYQRLKSEGLPAGRAVAFDSSLLVSPRMPVGELFALFAGGVTLAGDNGAVARVRCTDLKERFDHAIHLLSQTHTLKTGDMIIPAIDNAVLDAAERLTLTVIEEAAGQELHKFIIK